MDKRFVILGGGTAGWITALFTQKMFPESNITVVQSEKIGIIGVGEATTPNIIDYLDYVDVPLQKIFEEAGATIKNGINFENWHGDGTKYMHGFQEHLASFAVGSVFDQNRFDYYLRNVMKENKSFNEYTYVAKLSYENKVDPKNISYALHFDTTRFSKVLSDIGKTRGIVVIEDVFKEAVLNENGNIEKLILENQEVEGDFFFDCSGLNRLLIGKTFDTKWVSYRKHLPMKSAIPFWTDHKDHIEPFTTALAMKYGWMWKIPLQHRNGCGYVFDSDYIDAEQAQQEVEELLGHPIEVRKVIEFEAGRYEKYWVNNCIAVGLSSSFIEPLESTSIFLSIASLFALKDFVETIDDEEQSSIDTYNEVVGNNMAETLYFVYMHYMSKRKDTDFWRTFSDKYPVPDGLKSRIEKIKKNKLNRHDIPRDRVTASFGIEAYLQVHYPLEIQENEINLKGYGELYPTVDEYKNVIDSLVKTAPYHKDIFK